MDPNSEMLNIWKHIYLTLEIEKHDNVQISMSSILFVSSNLLYQAQYCVHACF